MRHLAFHAAEHQNDEEQYGGNELQKICRKSGYYRYLNAGLVKNAAYDNGGGALDKVELPEQRCADDDRCKAKYHLTCAHGCREAALLLANYCTGERNECVCTRNTLDNH